jgi:hypothetical protein
MSTSIRPSEHDGSVPIPGALLAPLRAKDEARSLLLRQLPVIQEMIWDLEEQTSAGRRYTMEKVVAFFRQQIGRGLLAVGPRNARVLAHLVDQLATASQHLIPDVHQFGDRAETLLSLLLATV